MLICNSTLKEFHLRMDETHPFEAKVPQLNERDYHGQATC